MEKKVLFLSILFVFAFLSVSTAEPLEKADANSLLCEMYSLSGRTIILLKKIDKDLVDEIRKTQSELVKLIAKKGDRTSIVSLKKRIFNLNLQREKNSAYLDYVANFWALSAISLALDSEGKNIFEKGKDEISQDLLALEFLYNSISNTYTEFIQAKSD